MTVTLSRQTTQAQDVNGARVSFEALFRSFLRSFEFSQAESGRAVTGQFIAKLKRKGFRLARPSTLFRGCSCQCTLRRYKGRVSSEYALFSSDMSSSVRDLLSWSSRGVTLPRFCCEGLTYRQRSAADDFPPWGVVQTLLSLSSSGKPTVGTRRHVAHAYHFGYLHPSQPITEPESSKKTQKKSGARRYAILLMLSAASQPDNPLPLADQYSIISVTVAVPYPSNTRNPAIQLLHNDTG